MEFSQAEINKAYMHIIESSKEALIQKNATPNFDFSTLSFLKEVSIGYSNNTLSLKSVFKTTQRCAQCS